MCEGAYPEFISKFINTENVGDLKSTQSTKGRTLNGILNETKDKKHWKPYVKLMLILDYMDDRPIQIF